MIAFFLGNTLMFCFGAIGGAFTGKDDIFYVMIAQGLAIPAIIVLGANIWTTNNNALYTGGLAISNITNARMKIATCISGVIGTALAIWLYYNFTGWLNILNCALPPIGITVILDFFLRRDKYQPDPCRNCGSKCHGSGSSVLSDRICGNKTEIILKNRRMYLFENIY